METKKLKKLSINKMQDFPVIGEQEQMALKGGDYSIDEMQQMMYDGTWEGGMVIGMGYVGLVVTVNGDAPTGSQSECPQCQQWHAQQERTGSYGGHEYTPIQEWFYNTLPHNQGWGDHQ